MKTYIYALIVAAMFAVFFGGMKFQSHRTEIGAKNQEIKEVEKIGYIKAGDVKNESAVKKKLDIVKQDQSSVLDHDLPDSVIDLLGGMHKP